MNDYQKIKTLRGEVSAVKTSLTEANNEIAKLKDSLDIAIVALEEITTEQDMGQAGAIAINALERIREFEWTE
jgi:hypothetical protein